MKVGPWPSRRAFDRRRGELEAGLDIVAVAMDGVHAMRDRDIRQRPVRLTLVEVGVDRIEVVLAHEDDGEAVQHRKVCALVKHAFFDRRVADKHHGDLAASHALVGKRAPHRKRYRAGNDGHARHHAFADVHEVHGAAAPADASGFLAANLGEHPFEVATFGQVVGVATVRAVDLVGNLQRRAHTDSGGFLADREMHRAAHFAFGVVIGDCLFHEADAQHALVQGDQGFRGRGARR